MSTFQKLQKEVLQLDSRSRAKLAEKLLASLDDLSESEAQELWLAEAEKRLSRFESGQSKATSARLALSQVRKRLAS